MTKKTRIEDLKTFDMAEMLDSDQDIADYLAIVLEENDTSALTAALGTVARLATVSVEVPTRLIESVAAPAEGLSSNELIIRTIQKK